VEYLETERVGLARTLSIGRRYKVDSRMQTRESNSTPGKRRKKAKDKRSKRPSLKQELSRLTRARIQESALALFRQTGYATTTVQDIANEAGVSHTTFYKHYKGKSAVLLALGEDTLPDTARSFRELLELRAPDWRAVRRWVDSHVRTLQRQGVHDLFIAAAYEGDREVLAQLMPFTFRVVKEMASILAEFRPGEQADMHLRLALMANFSSHSLFLASSASNRRIRNKILDAYTDILWNSPVALVSGDDACRKALERRFPRYLRQRRALCTA